MGLRAAVLRGVDTAFAKVGDLTTSVTYIKRVPTDEFDFVNQVQKYSESPAITIKGVISTTDKQRMQNSQLDGVIHCEVMFKSKDLSSATILDDFYINGELWRSDSYKSNDYVSNFILFKQ